MVGWVVCLAAKPPETPQNRLEKPLQEPVLSRNLSAAPSRLSGVPAGKPGSKSGAPLFPFVDRPQRMDVAQPNLTGGLGYTPSVRRGFATERSGLPFSRRDRSLPALRPCPGDGRGCGRQPDQPTTRRSRTLVAAFVPVCPSAPPGRTRRLGHCLAASPPRSRGVLLAARSPSSGLLLADYGQAPSYQPGSHRKFPS